MKNITKIGVFILLSIFTFTACDSDSSVSPFSTDEESALLDFMFLATADDSTGTTTNRNHGWRGGKKCNVTEVEVADLPAAITDYITANYAGATANRAGTLENGNYVVKITKADATHAGLVFDANGVFVEEKTGKSGSRGTEVAVADLPTTVTAYITANYAGATIKKAITNDEGKFLLIVQKADETYVGVGFEADGTFISEVTKRNKGSKSKG
ncbi:MAG: PepSY-like domain-containing protein [Spirosomaceae bacterium]|nr:PepSY-like domain-containing protein [Spirosomataceae bacterium]MDP5140033.1 PepSY-like domain-containing protein [Spirosomataceae bacterium]